MMTDAFLRGQRILIVEDEFLIAFELVHRVEDHGGSAVGPVGRVEQALQIATAQRLDGALLDINLGGQAAYAVADALIKRKIPVILVTGYSGDQLPERFRGIPKLPKPFPNGLGERIMREVFAKGITPTPAGNDG
jgi:CheY-like chemotaxis protein